MYVFVEYQEKFWHNKIRTVQLTNGPEPNPTSLS